MEVQLLVDRTLALSLICWLCLVGGIDYRPWHMRLGQLERAMLPMWWAPSFGQSPDENFGRVTVEYHCDSNCMLWEDTFWIN